MLEPSTERCEGFTRHPHHVNWATDKIHYTQNAEPEEEQQTRSSSKFFMTNIQGFFSSIATELQENLQEEEVMVRPSCSSTSSKDTGDYTNSDYNDLDSSCSLPTQTRRPSLPCFDSVFRKDALQRSQSAGPSASTTPSRGNLKHQTRQGSFNPATLSDEEFITLKKQLASSKYVTTAGMRHALAGSSSKPPSCSSLSSTSNSSTTTECNQHHTVLTIPPSTFFQSSSCDPKNHDQKTNIQRVSFVIAPAINHIHKITSSLKDEEVLDTENDTNILVSEKESCILATHGALSSREHDSLQLLDFESWNESPLRKSMATTTAATRCDTLLEEEQN